MTTVWNNQHQMGSASATAAVAAATPVAFVQQLDDIDKALFEYRYRKQNQQYHTSTSTKHSQVHGHYHQHQHQHQKHQKNGRSKNHNNNHHNHFGGNNQYHHVGNNNVPNRINYQAPVAATTVPQILTKQYQPEPHQTVIPISPDVFNNFSSRSATLVSSPPVSQGFTSNSPDSFLVSDDHFLCNSRLSSSVISSGGTSTSSYSSNEFEVVNKPMSATSFDGQYGFPITPVDKFGSNGFNLGHHGDDFNGTTSFNNGGANFNVNGKSEKSSGWLNIWGSDMSVWG